MTAPSWLSRAGGASLATGVVIAVTVASAVFDTAVFASVLSTSGLPSGGLLSGGAAYAAVPSQQALEESLTCQCGCGLTVHACNHLQCSSGIPLKQEIAQQIATGASQDQILGYFERKYGEKILSAPTARGFNLIAWLVPFVAIGLGFVLVAIVLVRWRRGSPVPGPIVAPAVDSSLRARLERELEEFERRH